MLRASLFPVMALLLGSPAKGQYGEGGYPPPSSPPPAAAAPSTFSAREVPTGIRAPKTALYKEVFSGNPAAENTVRDFTQRPHLISGRQYIAGYGAEEAQSGAYSLNLRGADWFGSAEQGSGQAELRLGMASPAAFGLGLILALNRRYTQTAGAENTTIEEGQGFGALGSFRSGVGDFFGDLTYYTGFEPLLDDRDITEDDEAGADITNTLLRGTAGWMKEAEAEGESALEVRLEVSKSDRKSPPGQSDSSLTLATLHFNYGYRLVEALGVAVYVGIQDSLAYKTSGPTKGKAYAFRARPNIGFHKTLGWNFETEAGLGFGFKYEKSEMDGRNAGGGEVTNAESRLLTDEADFRIALRWVYQSLAVEGLFIEEFLHDGPEFLSGQGNGMFAQVGVSFGF